ncbi:hypothetical protein N656DRAFT_782334 [Canariomyces notabilis]|uniref:Uncharacterized protein n=1 Tax=Canariomyces notabilis TaxID=2074819 RepID=A0AAN6TAD4_9PEZI|nr:hypothetical protein N656DRAFT_782334 [Canariomyces arenarius]
MSNETPFFCYLCAEPLLFGSLAPFPRSPALDGRQGAGKSHQRGFHPGPAGRSLKIMSG